MPVLTLPTTLTLPSTVRLRLTVPLRPSLPDGSAWTDHPVTPDVPIKAVHVNELRQAIDVQRQVVGLPPYPWTDNPVIAWQTHIKAAHFLELRAALQAVWTRTGRGPLPDWSCGSPPSYERVVYAADVNDLRRWVTMSPIG